MITDHSALCINKCAEGQSTPICFILSLTFNRTWAKFFTTEVNLSHDFNDTLKKTKALYSFDLGSDIPFTHTINCVTICILRRKYTFICFMAHPEEEIQIQFGYIWTLSNLIGFFCSYLCDFSSVRKLRLHFISVLCLVSWCFMEKWLRTIIFIC